MIIAIEASGARSSLALLVGERMVEEQFESRQRLSQELVPRLHRLVAGAGRRLGEIEKIAVSIGPGSFTSLRIGLTTAKALAHALVCPLVGVGTLDLLAQAAAAEAGARGARSLCVAVVARRAEAYAALASVSGGQPELGEPAAVSFANLVAFAHHGPPPVALCGTPFRSPEIAEQLSDLGGGIRLDPDLDWPSAGRLAVLAREISGVEPDTVVPVYLHLSQAETARGEGPAPWVPER